VIETTFDADTNNVVSVMTAPKAGEHETMLCILHARAWCDCRLCYCQALEPGFDVLNPPDTPPDFLAEVITMFGFLF